MKKYFLLLLISIASFSQNLNEFKYALVPSKFSFSKEPNEYNVNVLTKMFMEKYGFVAHLDSEILSDDFASTNCNKVYVNVIDNSSLFTTKLKVEIKDCKNNIIAISEEGTSREKEYKVAYNKALREAFDNFSVLKGHKYVSNTQIVIDTSNVGETTSEVINNKLSVVITENGFDLYNVEGKLVLSAIKTSVKNVFIAIAGAERGVLQKDSKGVWYYEYYREGSKKLISENLFFNL